MDVVNCPRCGRIFRRIISPICPACEKEEEEIFQKVRVFIDENKECTLGELSEGTGVSAKKILRYIREGRLEISKGMHGAVRCEICGRAISTGRFCEACMLKINQNIYDVISENSTQKQNTKMHISEK